MTGKVILVSGGAGGIGAECAQRLESEGARVLRCDLPGAGADVDCDITQPSDCDKAVQEALSRYGRLDGMVNCAGVSKPHDSLTLPPADWARMIDVQLNGAFYFAQACGRAMEKNGGAIVLITSTNAEAAFPRRAAYCAGKAGVAMLTKVLAIEWASLGIRVNAVGPAYVATEMTKRNIAAGNASEDQIKKRIPLGRLAQPADVADAVSYLLSDRASFITGHSLYVDGGWLAYGFF